MLRLTLVPKYLLAFGNYSSCVVHLDNTHTHTHNLSVLGSGHVCTLLRDDLCKVCETDVAMRAAFEWSRMWSLGHLTKKPVDVIDAGLLQRNDNNVPENNPGHIGIVLLQDMIITGLVELKGILHPEPL